MRDFFGTSAETKLAQAAPLLIAASRTFFYQATGFAAADKPLDAQYAWMMVYLLVNSRRNIDSTIKANADGTLTLAASRLRDYFQASIQGFTGDIPAIPADYAQAITLDNLSKTYRLTRVTEDNLLLKIRQVSIERRGTIAFFSLELAAPDHEILAACLVGIQAGSNSTFGYRILSVTQDESLPQTVAYGAYANAKYGYSMAYPLLFQSIEESAKGDGATFLSDGTVQLAIWGQPNAEGQAIQAIAEAAKLENPDFTVYICEADHFELAYPGDRGSCLYAYGRLIDGILIQFIFQYPDDQPDTYAAVIQDMVSSLTMRTMR